MQIPYEIVEAIEIAGKSHAKAKSIARLADETIKTMKARLMRRSEAKSISEREQEALSSDEYIAYVKAAIDAGEIEDTAKVKFEVAKAEFERQRSNAATDRIMGGSV